MQTRRQIIKAISLFLTGIPALWALFRADPGLAWTIFRKNARKILLPKDTPMTDLISKNPAKLDGRLLETTPMEGFDVMGQDIYDVDLENWRLTISGMVAHPRTFSYKQLLARSSQERNVLLICRGFFAYNALWKGMSMPDLLGDAGAVPGATHVKFSGPEGIRRKTKKFAIDEVMADKVFLAYQVNGVPLPERHGFPLRLVAEGHYGSRWVKYVNRIQVIGD